MIRRRLWFHPIKLPGILVKVYGTALFENIEPLSKIEPLQESTMKLIPQSLSERLIDNGLQLRVRAWRH